VADAAAALRPFLPFTSTKLFTALQINERNWDGVVTAEQLSSGHVIGQLPILFEKITDEVVAQQVAKLTASKAEATAQAEPISEAIAFEQFQQMDIRVVRILEAEAVPKTKKLLKLKIDTGVGERTVISGIAEHYSPEEVVGKHVLFLANLAPREIKGVKSEGMILMAENADGKLSFMTPERDVRAGSKVK
jgi:methionyl-tRNA synthetase